MGSSYEREVMMSHWKRNLAVASLVCAGAAALGSLSGCGGGGGNGGSPGLAASSSGLNVFVTDSFSDQYKQVLVTLYKIELTTDGTTYQTVFNDAAGQTINLSSLAATTDLLASLNVPAGTYTQARVTFADHFTLVSLSGTSTSTAVDPSVGTAANGLVALTIPTPTHCIPGQSTPLVIDFKLAEFTLVGNVLHPSLGLRDGGEDNGKRCNAHLGGTISTLVAGTSFDLVGENGRILHVALSPATTVINGSTGLAATLANGQEVRVEGAFDTLAQSVVATSVIVRDGTESEHQRVHGTVLSVDTAASTFVLTVDHAEGLAPTAGTIIVATKDLSGVTVGISINAEGKFDPATQTLTADSLFEGDESHGHGGESHPGSGQH